jgi:formamidopyrimidine-DNA glycosylase
MPEGPEVKTITVGLDEELKGKTLYSIEFSEKGKYREKSPSNFLTIEKCLPAKIKSVRCKGKFIIFMFKSEEGKVFYMGNSLGMSGIWAFSEKQQKHTCMTMLVGKEKIQFIDQRHFGCVHFYPDSEKLQEKLNTIGPDFLNTGITLKKFSERIKKKGKRVINDVLMDQSVVSGVGNYIKSEVLYRSKISPRRKIDTLDEKDISRLYDSISDIMEKSYKYNGMSQENYVTLEGEEGKYVNFLLVYRKKKDPKGNNVKAEKMKGRTTYWVPEIQK